MQYKNENKHIKKKFSQFHIFLVDLHLTAKCVMLCMQSSYPSCNIYSILKSFLGFIYHTGVPCTTSFCNVCDNMKSIKRRGLSEYLVSSFSIEGLGGLGNEDVQSETHLVSTKI